MKCVLRSIREERGQALVLGALVMFAVAGFAALSIDVGQMMHERRELQNAADAVALAGAQELGDCVCEVQPAAEEWAAKNGVDVGEELTSVEVTSTYAHNDTITVDVERDVPYVFAGVLSFGSQTIHGRAVARIGSPTVATNAMPWALRESYKESAVAAGYGQPVVLMESAGGGSSGAFGGLCFGGHCGASDYRDAIEQGAEIDLENSYEMKTGVMPGPTGQGMDYRLGNTTPECDTFDEVFQQMGEDDWAFTSNTCNPWTEEGSGSLRVVLAPVIEDYYYDECGGTSCMVQASAFAILFLEDPSECVTPEHPDEPLVCARFLRASFDIGFLIGAYNPDSDVRFVRLVE